MPPDQKKILNDIKQWLHEYKIFNFQEVRNEDNSFTIETKLKSKPKVLPISIYVPKQPNEEIILFWLWGFAPGDIKSLRMIDMNLKQKFAADVQYGFDLLNLSLRFHESLENIKAIYTENYIHIDELSKDRLLKNITELGYALNAVGKKFKEYFPLPSDFDPSFHV